MGNNSTLTPGSIPTPADGYSVADIATYTTSLPEVSGPVEGTFRGTIVAAGALTFLPTWARRTLTHIVGASATSVWRGKTFSTTAGTNLWGARRAPRQFGRFTQTITDNGIHVLDYNVTANPTILRGIRGDLWDLGAGTYLGRMRYVTRRKSYTLIYFTLEK